MIDGWMPSVGSSSTRIFGRVTMARPIAAAALGLSLLEVRDHRIQMTRHGDYLMRNGKFPRLYQKSPPDRLDELLHVLENWDAD